VQQSELQMKVQNETSNIDEGNNPNPVVDSLNEHELHQCFGICYLIIMSGNIERAKSLIYFMLGDLAVF